MTATRTITKLHLTEPKEEFRHMKRFTTDYNVLVQRASEAMETRDDDLFMESFEALGRFHRDKLIDEFILEYAGALGYAIRQFSICEIALSMLLSRNADPSSKTHSRRRRHILILGVILSRHLHRKIEALRLLSELAEAPDPFSESRLPPAADTLSVSAEMVRLEDQDIDFKPPHFEDPLRVFETPSPRENALLECARLKRILGTESFKDGNPSALQSVVSLTCDPIDGHLAASELARATGVPQFEFMRRFALRTGILLKGVANAEYAGLAVQVLRGIDIPCCYVDDEIVMQSIPRPKRCQRVGINEDGMTAACAGIGKEFLFPWSEIFAADAFRIAETTVEKKAYSPTERASRVLTSSAVFGVYGAMAHAASRLAETKTVHKEKIRYFISVYCRNPECIILMDLEEGAIVRPYNFLSTVPKSKEEWLAEIILRRATEAAVGAGIHCLSRDGLGGDWSNATAQGYDEMMERMAWLSFIKQRKLL
ncbi:MAG: hypothetical protein Kow00107_06370 [Planctomycetota bacterium]